jgi:addiction module RelB/DinJ family antitoxin
MATKTANVLARVEPEVKEQAEAIMGKLGVPASTVINMLYRQIIMTKSIPFSLSVPSTPVARDEMDTAAFDAMMQQGLNEAKAGQGVALDEAFTYLRKSI